MTAARRPLYCFAHAGGGTGVFRTWSAALPGAIEVRAVPYADSPAGPLRGTSVAELAAASAASMAAEADGDFAFFGHSMGALVAFETARELRRAGRPGPAALIVSGHTAPHLPTPGPDLHALPERDFWRELELLGGTPPEVMQHQELRRVLEPRLRAEFRAAETYRFRSERPLDCALLALAGSHDPRGPVSGVEEWRSHTAGGFASAVLPGDHFFIESARAELLRRIAGHLLTREATAPAP